MITITLRTVHIAIAAAFLAGVLIAVGVVLSSGGGGDPEDALAGAAIASQPSPTAEPTSTPQPAPTEAPEPTSPPAPEPTAAPEFRTCEGIRATGTYNSDAERQFFLETCITNAAASPPPVADNPNPDAPATGDATAQEALYRDRAEGNLIIFAVKLGQYFNTPALGGLNDLLEFGAILRRQAQDLDRLPAPPPRFQQVHDQLRGSLISYADYVITIVDVDLQDQEEVLDWLDAYITQGEFVVAALQDFALVVGFELPADLVE